MNTQQILPVLIMLHFYLSIRFAFRASFKYAEVYSFYYTILVILLPFAGYFIAMRRLKKEQDALDCTEENISTGPVQ
ncbi:hypothetical protein [Pedobacter nyackensis]|uniref:Uncharacterized protein n=1 Tax=Pedobacter nyackensis TaxID=475255 RepID=A0A1W2ET19_9SPHI|nr:hypothetical protein [Pedobacter nyackensis]SMD12860.1 hypothetical protein SAMN04488101_115114 [Pedobacter nyackensis]